MNEAIEIAIVEGRYMSFRDAPLVTEAHATIREDPAFWQALGKALGWKDGEDINTPNRIGHIVPMWRINWHRFIDHIAEGKEADDFFKALLAERRVA